MKNLRIALTLLLVMMLCIGSFAACKESDNPTPTDKSTEAPTDKPTEGNADKPTEKDPPKVPEEDKYPTITVAKALELCGEESGNATTERYYIRAKVTEMLNASYGEMTISDDTGSIYVYGTYSEDGSLKFDQLENKPGQGDEVLLYCTLQNYNGKKEVQNARLIEFTKGDDPIVPPPVVKPEDGAEITIAQALEICASQGETETTERYIIKATVVSITNAQYGAMTIKDETGEIAVYGTYSADGSIGYADMTDKPYKGDSVVLSCTLHSFRNSPEVRNARLISFTKNDKDVDESQYTEMSVSEARDAATGTKIKVDGVVARITYANGMKPMGIYLVDDTQSIYVYDGYLAQRVQIGNKVTILGSKAYWILDSEKSNAEKFGYGGCCQLEDVTLLDIDEGVVDFDKSWITESTVKDIVDTPVTNNITSTIFKVNAIVRKVPNTSFINYYFYDLDDSTSSYAYTQCNGNDFAWLDEFDGKICTVYLSALNAKSTSSACYFRFIPVAVIDEGFVFNTNNAPEFALKYHGMGQFFPEYSADPVLELITSVSSELLGFENVVLTYTSSNQDSVYFETVDGVTFMHCGAAGKAIVTVTATYGEITESDTFEITVIGAESFEYVSVKDAIDAAKGTELIVKGIVGPSLVNQSGFYLIDESGVIAVRTDADVMATLNVGNEVIVSGKRDIKTKGGTEYFGQSYLADGVVLANNYGAYEYSTAAFDTTKTFAQLCELKNDALTDYSTTVFVVQATINVTGSGYSTNVSLTDADGNKFELYCSGAGQYEFLKQFDGQEVTLEVAACNWNDKKFWKGCVLAVHTDDGKVINQLNFK